MKSSEPPLTASEMTEEDARHFVSQIPRHADQHRVIAGSLFDIKLDYSADSILALDLIIKQGWPEKSSTMLNRVVLGFGSYLGETIRHIHGGDWCYDPEYGLYLDVGGLDVKILPFAKVHECLTNGEDGSLEHYYSFICLQVARARKLA